MRNIFPNTQLIKNYIRRVKESKGISQNKLAEDIGFNKIVFSQTILARKNFEPPAKFCILLAKYMSILLNEHIDSRELFYNADEHSWKNNVTEKNHDQVVGRVPNKSTIPLPTTCICRINSHIYGLNPFNLDFGYPAYFHEHIER